MVLTHHVLPLAKPKHTVQHLSLEEGEELLAWAEKNRTFSIARMDGTGLVPVATVAIDHNVSFLMFHRTHLVVGDDLGHLFFYDHKGVLLETQDVDGGGSIMPSHGSEIGGSERHGSPSIAPI